MAREISLSRAHKEKLEEFEERWEKRGSNGSFVQGHV